MFRFAAAKDADVSLGNTQVTYLDIIRYLSTLVKYRGGEEGKMIADQGRQWLLNDSFLR